MADTTLSKLIHLLTAVEAPELRRAAARVSGSIGTSKDRNLVKALLANLQDTDLELRLTSIEALGQLQAEDALEPLEAFVRQGGPEVEAAVQASSHLGGRGIRVMGKIMHDAAPALRSRIAAVLARSGTGGGLVVTAHALLDPDPKVVDAAVRSLAAEVPALNAAQKQALGKFLVESLQVKQELAPKTEAAMLRLLGTLQDKKAEDTLWSRLGAEQAPEVRVAALHALGHYAPPADTTRLQRLAACAAASDFQTVAHALMILKQVATGAKNAKLWLKLLHAPDVATRRFAVDKLQGLETGEVAGGLVDQLGHPDRALRDDARRSLLHFAKGRQALFAALLKAATVDESWDLARTLAPAAKDMTSAMRASLFDQACVQHDREDRRAASLWFLLREIDPRWVRDQIEVRALALRKKKKYAEALAYFHLLIQEPGCSEDIRFEFAATNLKLSKHDTAVEARQTDHALGQFARLLQNPAFPVIDRVKQAKWLDSADLFYLGFHFVEQSHRERTFGTEVLELLVKRSPKTELGKNARKKLRSAGV